MRALAPARLPLAQGADRLIHRRPPSRAALVPVRIAAVGRAAHLPDRRTSRGSTEWGSLCMVGDEPSAAPNHPSHPPNRYADRRTPRRFSGSQVALGPGAIHMDRRFAFMMGVERAGSTAIGDGARVCVEYCPLPNEYVLELWRAEVPADYTLVKTLRVHATEGVVLLLTADRAHPSTDRFRRGVPRACRRVVSTVYTDGLYRGPVSVHWSGCIGPDRDIATPCGPRGTAIGQGWVPRATARGRRLGGPGAPQPRAECPAMRSYSDSAKRSVIPAM